MALVDPDDKLLGRKKPKFQIW